MKKFILIFAMFLSLNVVFGQTATVRLEMPATLPNVGEQFLVGVWLDELSFPGGDPTILSGLFAWDYDPAVLTAVSTGPPFNRWYHNQSPMFIDYGALPVSSNPAPGDLRVFFATGQLFGFDPSLYGFVSGVTPWKFWDLKFTYLGGDIEITWDTEAKLEPIIGEQYGGTLAKAQTEMYAPGTAAGFPYALNLIGIGGGAPCTPGLWTGLGGDGDWFNIMNWDCQEVPVNIDVVIPGATKASVVIGGGIATVANLTVGAGSDLTIDYDGGLTTNGLFTNDGTFTIESEGANGFAGSYIDLGGIAGTGLFEFNRNVICSGTAPGVSDPFGWHYLSAPIAGFTTDDIPDYFANSWDQATGMWMQMYMDPAVFPCTPYPTTPLMVMDAWSVNRDVTYPDPNCVGLPPATGPIVPFSGGAADMHTGVYAKVLGYGAGMYQDWNLVGNPYPSGLDLNTLTWGLNTVQGAAFYDGCVGNYVYWTPALGAYSMAPTLGFFVQTTGPDNLMVDNTNRAHNPDWFWKGEVSNLLTIQASGNELSDILHVRFMDGVTAGFDLNGDFNKLFSTTEGIAQIYTVAGENKLAVNALPATEVVPMGFLANSSGTYTIEAIETSEFSEVILEDKVTNTFTNLLTSTYTFDYTLGANEDRFNIHFAPLSVSDINADDISIWSNEDKIYVNVPGTVNGDIVVYNMMGQEVVRTNVAPGLNVIPMTNNNAYYVVKVVSSETAVTGKVYIK
jgi:hypothetical protein